MFCLVVIIYQHSIFYYCRQYVSCTVLLMFVLFLVIIQMFSMVDVNQDTTKIKDELLMTVNI